MELTRENYHSYPAVSNSSLNLILPECGGSPRKYEDNTLFPMEESDSSAMRLGTLAHAMVEQKGLDNFEISKVPTPAIAMICDEILNHPTLADAIASAPIMEKLILNIARDREFQPKWKDETIVKKIVDEGTDYLLQKEKAKATGKVLITEEEKASLERMKSSLEDTAPWLFDDSVLPDDCDEGDKVEILRELPLLFNMESTEEEGVEFECKSLLDIVVINHTRKFCRVYDLKTTNIPLSIYLGYLMSERDEDGIKKYSKVEGTVHKYFIYRQLAFYDAAIQTYNSYERKPGRIIACETQGSYESRIYQFENKYYLQGRDRIQDALTLLKKHNLINMGGL